MELLIEIAIVVGIVGVIAFVWKVVDEHICNHICPRKKECNNAHKNGELPPCVKEGGTCNMAR